MSNFLTNPFIMGGAIVLAVGVYLLLKDGIVNIGLLTTNQKVEGVLKAGQQGGDLFDNLSEELVDEEEVDEELKSLLER